VRAHLSLLSLSLIVLWPARIFAGQQANTPAPQAADATAPPPTQTTPPAQTGAAPEAKPLVWVSTTVPAAAGSKEAKEAAREEADEAKEAAKEAAKGSKSKKAVYSGPTQIVDQEGRQQLDPDGKPMFNPSVKQQRDKNGHPLFDGAGKPVFQTETELGFDEHGKKIRVAKEKPPKMVPVKIVQGTFSVDGNVGKAALNYDIADFKYIYMYVPGMGVVVVSNLTFPGAKEQQNAFDDKTLTVTVAEHKLELASEQPLLAGKKPEPAFVRIDRDFALPSRFPVIGYGPLRVAPYSWPGAKKSVVVAGAVQAPPLPKNITPVLALQPCPKGQMRVGGQRVLPGQTAPPAPCVAIPKGTAPEADAP
jgi:hypothetical protein